MIETLLWGFLAYLAIYYIREFLEKLKSPPGPIPIPILGNLIQIATAHKIPSLAFAKFAETYGEVFQLRMGMKTMVVPASVEAINTIFSRPECTGRDQTGSWHDRNFNKNLGIVFSDGPFWEKTKTWTIKSLKDYGFGKSSTTEGSIYEEIKTLFEGIDKTRSENKNIVKVSGIFVLPVFKIMWHMVTGHSSTGEEMKAIENLLIKSELSIAKGIFGAGLVAAYPFVRFIIPESTGHSAQMAFYKDAHTAARVLLEQSKTLLAKSGKTQPENLVEAFVLKMKEEEGNPDTIFREENFIVIYMDLLQAGSDTNSAFLEGFLLFMVLYPDVQAKIYAEIEQHVQSNQEICFEDRKKMIYTQAAMWEIHRHQKVVQNLVTRRVLEDFYYKKYLIKKDTIMLANLHAAYFSPAIWPEDPTAFKPERFIGENGELVKVNCVMPFGAGKRICPGEVLSHITSFLYAASILQRYKLSVVPGKPKPSQQMHEGFTSKPFPFEIMVSDRH